MSMSPTRSRETANDGPEGESARAGAGGVVLEVDGIAKTYTARGRTVEALRDITFAVRAGEFTCIVGPSGAGKTTLLKSIAGLMEPTAGVVRLDDQPYRRPPEGMAVVFQEYGRSLLPWLTVGENVGLPLKAQGIPRRERAERVRDALAAVGLPDSSAAHPWQLSGGMQQRVAIARAVAYQPRILIMDEPFAAVDAQTRADLEDLVYSLSRKRGYTVLFVTHDIDEAVYLGDRVLVLSKSPSVIKEEIEIDLPRERNHLTTRSGARFLELRQIVHNLIHDKPETATGAVSDLDQKEVK